MCIPPIGTDSKTMIGTTVATTATRRRTTKSASLCQNRPLWAALTAALIENRSSRPPSSTSAAGVIVRAAATAISAAPIAPVASDSNTPSPVTYSPASAVATVRPETVIARPVLCSASVIACSIVTPSRAIASRTRVTMNSEKSMLSPRPSTSTVSSTNTLSCTMNDSRYKKPNVTPTHTAARPSGSTAAASDRNATSRIASVTGNEISEEVCKLFFDCTM